MLDVHAIGIEFGNARRCDDDARGMAVLEDGERKEESVAEALGWISGFWKVYADG